MHDTEQTTFDAAGTVLTADGSRFDISLEPTLSRAFHSSSDVSVRAGDGIRKDPLVIHFLLARCGALTPRV